MKKILVAIIILVSGAILGTNLYNSQRLSKIIGQGGTSQQSQATYRLNLVSGKSYMVAKPTMISFAIKDQDDKLLKDFDTVHEKNMHLIVVRKDRTNFQHVHPALDKNTGIFTIKPFTFPTDGEYRIYADFTASSAKKDEKGIKLVSTPYQDVQVGDLSKYTSQPLGNDNLASSTNGLDASIFFPPPADSLGATDTNFYARQESDIVIAVDKGGQLYKNLQRYLGALGHMVVLGDDLEFIHGHAQTDDVNTQGGVIVFSVNFPKEGRYRLYLQTKSDNKINTTDYTLTIKSKKTNTSPQPKPDKDHNRH